MANKGTSRTKMRHDKNISQSGSKPTGKRKMIVSKPKETLQSSKRVVRSSASPSIVKSKVKQVVCDVDFVDEVPLYKKSQISVLADVAAEVVVKNIQPSMDELASMLFLEDTNIPIKEYMKIHVEKDICVAIDTSVGHLMLHSYPLIVKKLSSPSGPKTMSLAVLQREDQPTFLQRMGLGPQENVSDHQGNQCRQASPKL